MRQQVRITPKVMTESVTVSAEYQVVIPLRVRRALGIRPGQKLQVILYDGLIQLVPVKPIEEMEGFLLGIDTNVERDSDRV